MRTKDKTMLLKRKKKTVIWQHTFPASKITSSFPDDGLTKAAVFFA
ncbi:hypothetical protein RUMOBE_00903 [Blautia obeum ATCC 29174]|jgi:hypothetical protein|uniref:Uncharacterized protein n=1 Tax=Blautia obeum ATCC 29174 TaxID=411459 RepID=A5ZPI6_9FIRM|nr:hypothetical protein [Blautia obeum]EDM88782.1 hypothetical protein RUMOBE_00903 [Blautia obeum ATCC 29174]